MKATIELSHAQIDSTVKEAIKKLNAENRRLKTRVENLEKAKQFGIGSIVIYYDATGELRFNRCAGKYQKKKLYNKKRRLYTPESFDSPGVVLETIGPIIDQMIKEAREIKLIGIKHYPTGVNVHVRCKCGCEWWVNATAALISDTVRTSCRRCKARGLINWQDVIKSSELRVGSRHDTMPKM